MDEDSLLPLELPAVARKKVSLAFDGGRLSSDGGVLLLRAVECRLCIAQRLAACMTDRRDPARADHTVVEMLRLRMLAVAAVYEDADACDSLRDDPVFKMAVGRAPETGRPLCSQPTMSRLENAPSRDTPPQPPTCRRRDTSAQPFNPTHSWIDRASMTSLPALETLARG